ncbi:ABC transporter permease subunit [Dehalococcoidia bacterium]|nr:ABC transporter permease subunit [Dehalococcoidia bacterium]MCL0098191.1 ABC transporter permease subunit [Dehalococcoidia bacterium]
MLWSVFYKEFLELKSDKGAIVRLVLQSMVYGLFFPTVMYLQLVGVLPMEIGDVVLTEAEKVAMVKHSLETFGPLLLPFFVSVMASLLVTPSIVQEAESRTLERLLSLPLSWRKIFFGKFLFCFAISLACAYIIVSIYFLLSSAIVEAFQPPALLTYVFVLVPAVVFFTVSAGLFASARARSVKMANVSAAFLTWGLFLVIFFVAWGVGVEPGRDIMLTFGFMLFAVGLKLAYYTARVNPERLLYGHSP